MYDKCCVLYTSAKDVVCSTCRLSLLLSVCLLAISRKIYPSNLYANFTKDVSSDKDAIKFYKLSRDPAWHRSALSDSIVMRSSTN